MKGEGVYAEQISAMFKVARKKFIQPQQIPEIDYSLFRSEGRQISLF